MHRSALLLTATLLLGSPAHAQDRTERIDEIFGFVTPETPGCVVGASRDGRVVVERAYGLADVERGVPLTAHSVFDIGSIQKQFVAAAILILVEEGRLSLSDDVREHVPELPDYGHTITLDHLLTHTSGLRDWIALRGISDGDPDVMTIILRQRGLNFAPGEEFSYSNSGWVLLKEIVARTSGRSFADFARERLFVPLGMDATAFVPDLLHAGENATLAYQKQEGGWQRSMMLGNARGDGAIASTARDLLVWNDALTSGRLGAFVTGKLEERARLNNGRIISYARGLMVEPHRGTRMVWHSGGAAGYSAWMGRFTEHDLSVVVMCNFEPVSATALAHRVAGVFLPEGEPVAATAASAPSGDATVEVDPSARAGLFLDHETARLLRLGIDEGELRIAGLRAPLVPVAGDRFRIASGDLFFRSQDQFEIRFLSPDRFELTSMEGATTRFDRVGDYTPAASDLAAYAGVYRSPDLASSFEIRVGPDGVAVHRVGSDGDGNALRPIARDVFQLGLMTFRFQRDGDGNVVAMELNNPALRGLLMPREGSH